MATTRFYAEAGRIIMSKPGYWASPSLPDVFKIFDSDWSAGNVLIASGSIFAGGGTHAVSFPAQHFIPIVNISAFRVLGGLDHRIGSRVVSVSNNGFTAFLDTNATRFDYAVYGI